MYLRPFLSALLIALVTTANAQREIKKLSPCNGNMAMQPISFNGKIYLYANDYVNGFEFCEYDGTYVKPIITLDSDPGYRLLPVATVHNNKLYFEGRTAAKEVGIYEYDGVNPAKLLVAVTNDVFAGNIDFLQGSGNYLFFTKIDDTSRSLIGYDLVNNQQRSIEPSITGNVPFVFLGKLFFNVQQNSISPIVLASFDPATLTYKVEGDLAVGKTLEYNGRLYFQGSSPTEGREYYSWDGMIPPKMISHVEPGINSFAPMVPHPELYNNVLGVYKGEIYMGGWDQNKTMVFKYNPQSEQMTGVGKFEMPMGYMFENFVVYKDWLLFTMDFHTGDPNLFIYDGNNDGSRALWRGETVGPNVDNVLSANDKLYFSDMFNYYEFSDPTLSVGNTNAQTTISIYPNPASDELHFKAGLAKQQQLTISVTDITGKLLYSEKKQYKPANEMTIRVASLTAGVYLYSIKDEQNNTVAAGKFEKK